MLCLFVRRYIPVYKNGELTGARARVVGRHLERCVRCRRAMEKAEAAREMLGGWREVEAKPHLHAALRKRIDSYERAREGDAPVFTYRPGRRPVFAKLFSRPVLAYARVAVALVLVAALTATLLPDRSIAQAVEISGVVLVAQPGTANWQYLTKDMKIYKGMKFRFTGDKDFVDLKVIRSDDIIRLRKAAQGDIPRRMITVKVRSGIVKVHSADRAAATKFKVLTPSKILEIQGNVCMITTKRENGQTNVLVEELPS